jgi:hypothetical protein
MQVGMRGVDPSARLAQTLPMRFASVAALAVSILCVSAPARAGECDRSCLRAITDRYLAALVDPAATPPPLSGDVRYTENGRALPPGESPQQKVSGLGDYRRYLEDPETQQAFFIGTLDEAGEPALVALRLGIREQRIAEVEAIVARKGSHALFAPERFARPDPVWSSALGADDRRSRPELVAIANSYFDGLERHDSRGIAASTTCRRIENGVQTTQRNGDASAHCAASADRLRYIERVANRRFPVVDAERGIVVATVLFDIPGESRVDAALQRPRMLLLTELFKIEDGQIQQIEAVMHNLPHGSASGWPD